MIMRHRRDNSNKASQVRSSECVSLKYMKFKYNIRENLIQTERRKINRFDLGKISGSDMKELENRRRYRNGPYSIKNDINRIDISLFLTIKKPLDQYNYVYVKSFSSRRDIMLTQINNSYESWNFNICRLTFNTFPHSNFENNVMTYPYFMENLE